MARTRRKYSSSTVLRHDCHLQSYCTRLSSSSRLSTKLWRASKKQHNRHSYLETALTQAQRRSRSLGNRFRSGYSNGVGLTSLAMRRVGRNGMRLSEVGNYSRVVLRTIRLGVVRNRLVKLLLSLVLYHHQKFKYRELFLLHTHQFSISSMSKQLMLRCDCVELGAAFVIETHVEFCTKRKIQYTIGRRCSATSLFDTIITQFHDLRGKTTWTLLFIHHRIFRAGIKNTRVFLQAVL